MFQKVEVKDLAFKMNIIMKIYGFNSIDDFPKNSYLSGSSAVRLLKNEKISNFSDLDIYIECGLSRLSSNAFVNNLKSAGYIQSSKKFEYVQNMLIADKSTENNIDASHEYFSLKEHITKIISLDNGNKKIDIIIMKDSIENLLINTFDYDIVKNYIKIKDCEDYMYVNNLKSIETKKAKMSKKHFKVRIMDNAYEFNNFVKRFMKYKFKKGYNMFIEDVEITDELFMDIIKCVFDEIDNIEVFTSKDLLNKGIIANIIHEDTLYRISSFNESEFKLLFKIVYSLFKQWKVQDSIQDIMFEKLETKNKCCSIFTNTAWASCFLKMFNKY